MRANYFVMGNDQMFDTRGESHRLKLPTANIANLLKNKKQIDCNNP